MKVKFTNKATQRLTTGTASPLMRFLAGEHADRLAVYWPNGHERFLVLPSARRHAAAILAAGLAKGVIESEADFVRMIERQKDRVLAEVLVGPDRSSGLMKALNKFGEMLWTETEYRNFLALFCEPEANRNLRHLDEIRPAMLRPMEILPPVLRQSRLLSFVRHLAAARDIATAFSIVEGYNGKEAMAKVAERWTRAATRQRLFEMIREDLIPERPIVWRQPPVLSLPYERVDSLKGLKAIALEFKNCLMDYKEAFSSGRMAVYVWRADPKAVFALNWNTDGWRLAEAEGVDNDELDEPVLKEIVKTLSAHKVRTGSSVLCLGRRMEGYGGEAETYECAELNREKSFSELCDLGNLWD